MYKVDRHPCQNIHFKNAECKNGNPITNSTQNKEVLNQC